MKTSNEFNLHVIRSRDMFINSIYCSNSVDSISNIISVIHIYSVNGIISIVSIISIIRIYSIISIIFFFFFLISLIADGPHHYHPACGHKGYSHLSPVHALQFFIAMQVQHSYNSSTNG